MWLSSPLCNTHSDTNIKRFELKISKPIIFVVGMFTSFLVSVHLFVFFTLPTDK